MKKRISIIVPFYYSSKKKTKKDYNLSLLAFEKCLSAISKSNYKNYELITVSDGSCNQSIKIAENYADNVVKIKKNSGPGNSRNIGAKLAKGKILLFIDSDIEIKPNALEIVNRRYKIQNSLVGLQGIFSHKPDYKKSSTQYMQSYLCYYLFSEVMKKKYTGTICTSFFSIKKNLFFKLNGFDTKFKSASAEDSDFGMRLNKEGYKVQIERKIRVNHHTNFDLWGFVLRILRIHTDEMKMYLRNKSFSMKINQSNYSMVIFGIILISCIIMLPIVNSFYTLPHFLNIFIFINLLFILIIYRFLKFIYLSKGFLSTFKALLFSYLHRFLFICCIIAGLTDFYIFKNKY